MAHCIYLVVTCYNFQIKDTFHSLNMDTVLENSANPDKMPHDAVYAWALACQYFKCSLTCSCLQAFTRTLFRSRLIILLRLCHRDNLRKCNILCIKCKKTDS